MSGQAGGVEQRRSRGLRASSAGASPSKTIGVRARTGLPLLGQRVDLLEVGLALLVGEPDDLEEVVALGGAVGVVVDRPRRARESHLAARLFSARIRWRIDLAALQARSARPSGPGCSAPG